MKKEHFPDILFLMETMNSDPFIMKVFRWLGYDYFHTVEPDGKSGGLAIFWKHHLVIDFLSEDKNLLDMKVSQGQKSWFVSCVYGNPRQNLRHMLMDRLSLIGVDRKLPWCMIGDFNEIMSNKEKLGGPSRVLSSFQDFKDMLKSCDMHELGSSGNSFTWGGTRNDEWIQCKLDRCFGNSNWFTLFPNSHQWFLEKLGSDHKPVLVKFINDQEVFRGHFRFDKRFAEDPICEAAIQRSWNGNLSSQVSSSMIRMFECRKAISHWKKDHEYNAHSRIKRLRLELDDEKSAQFPCWTKISSIQDLLGVAFREEESFWRLKSRDKWMTGGDKNSKFFQATVKANRITNSLSFLVDENGCEHTITREKGHIAVKYFEDLFTSSYSANMDSVLDGFRERVT